MPVDNQLHAINPWEVTNVTMNRKTENIRLEIASMLRREKIRRLMKAEALGRLFSESQNNPQQFHEDWVAPLLDTGLSLESAFTYIVEFHLHPN
ncbi:MAG TPA: hypothetical protein VEK33_02710 [Terriglobales bacterium]|nr:hypothetical protein [Terriglobales bacterium]